MITSTIDILRKELVGKKLVVYDNYWENGMEEPEFLRRDLYAYQGYAAVKIGLLITDISLKDMEKRELKSNHLEIVCDKENYTMPFWHIEIED